LAALRTTPQRARDAVIAANYRALGQVMSDNTEMQRDLHPALVSQEADEVIEIAKAHGALGWKVNGAGGEGGSLTLICGDSTTKQRQMIETIEATSPLFQNVPIHLTRNGVYAWEVNPVV
jgi:D-glycero-alpha-D-manno-heptose-7-phosphate kinase